MPNPKFRVSGAFFENQKGGPAYTGFVEIDGVRTAIALWPKTSQAGNDYLQVSEDKKKDQGTGGGGGMRNRAAPPPRPTRPTARPHDDMDDDAIPFAPEWR